ncbi:MAG TPA: signal recognition particle protein [Bacillota bacterium]|nr:signal recognition particle protein [Bacillota bacterium]HQD39709.1 signal recognition particle protein [Bacillota bacterium]
MFGNLTSRLEETFRRLRGRGKLSEADVDQAMREVRMALLEADVNYKVVKDFTAKVKERAKGQEVLASITPAQQVIKIVYDELVELMGEKESKIKFSSTPPTVIMLCGLQGAGKTTTAAKLAAHLRRQGRKPLLVAADIYRPAAVKQLQILGDQISIPVYHQQGASPVQIAQQAVDHAKAEGLDVVLIDTAGRLQIDQPMMQELSAIRELVEPDEILLVLDAMTGQEAVDVAKTFNARLELDGVILTKLDGDARGGAALSIRSVVGAPIKFAATGEKLDALETFHPDRMASRILGMGDVVSLVEKAQQAVDLEKAKEMERKLRKAQFTLDDFLSQLEQMKKMGPLDQLLQMLPGVGGAKALKNLQVDEKQLDRIQAIIQSMTVEERNNPGIINGSRKKRIALGSGTKVQDVNRLLKDFEQTRKMIKQLTSGRMGKGWPFAFH